MWVNIVKKECVCVCISLYVFECLKLKKLNVLIAYS
jgi:hypothetical protein